MKKTYILTVMLLVLTVILSGCGSQDSDQASSGSFELSVEDTDTAGFFVRTGSAADTGNRYRSFCSFLDDSVDERSDRSI